MLDPKLNYHHQFNNKKGEDKHSNNMINPQIYDPYFKVKDKPRPMSENVTTKEQKRIQQEQYKQQLDKQILENELRSKEKFTQQRKNLNSACTENIIKGQGIFSSNADWDQKEKEKQRLKKLDYHQDLKRQIEEKNQLKEKEKQKRLNEEKKYQHNDNQHPLNKSISNKLQLQSANSITFHPTNNTTNNQQPFVNEEQSSLKASNIGLQNQYIPQTQQYFYNNPNYYNDNTMSIENKIYPSSCPQQYLPNQQIPQYAMNCPLMPSDSTHIPNLYMQHQLQMQQPYNPMPISVENLFKNFVNDQINVISNYEAKVENFDDGNSHQMDVYNTLTQEKLIAIEKIKQEQDKIRTCLGFYPMENQFNDKITNLLDIILETKLEQIQKKKLSTSTTNNNNLISINNPAIYSTKPVNLYQSNHSFHPPQNQINTSNLINPNLNRSNNISSSPSISNAGYKSKYEDVIKQSILNGDDINPEFKQSLVGFSKFVSANNNNISGINNTNNSYNNSSLMKTWKGDNEMDDHQMTHLSSIKEEQIKYNISPSQILMSNNEIYEENKDNNIKHDDYINHTKNKEMTKMSFIVNKDISAILPSRFEMGMCNGFNDKSNLNFDIMNNDISAIGMGIDENKTRFNNDILPGPLDDSIMDQMKISKEEKDKTLIFNRKYCKEIEESNDNIIFNNSMIPYDETQNKSLIKRTYYEVDDNDQCNIKISINSDKATENKQKDYQFHPVPEEEDYHFDNEEIPSDCDDNNKKDKQIENDDYDEYNNEFTNDQDIAQLDKKEIQDNRVDLNDYKEIHESQKFETKMNFFDDQDNVSQSKINAFNQVIQSQKDYSSFLQKSEVLNDSFGDDIIKGMNKYHTMAKDNKKSYNNY